jgi:DNA-binding HxlR family transcriptional regulator
MLDPTASHGVPAASLLYPEVPPRVEYGLTPEGMKLRPLINDLCAWGQKFSNRQSPTSSAVATPLPVE